MSDLERRDRRPEPPRVPPDTDHWLVRPSTVRLLWIVFTVILAATVLLQLAVPIKGYFGVDGWFGFGAGYGFLGCVAMVLVAKGMGAFLKRPDDYYAVEDDGEEAAGEGGRDV
jgi:hypothetical protein